MEQTNKDDKVRDYFLGRLSETESERFEEELALDEALFADAGAIERELIDDYLRDELSSGDREAFETNYLRTDARRDKLFLAEGLWQVAKDERSTEINFVEKQTPGWRRAWIILCAGAAAALLLIGISWGIIPLLVTVEVGKVSEPGGNGGFKITAGPDQTATPSGGATVATSSPDNSVVVQAPVTPTPVQSGKPASTVVAFTLVPGAMRDQGEQSINIPPQSRTVQLSLEKAKGAPEYPSYSATLKTADGETVLTVPKLRSMHLQVHALLLENRTYVLFLEGVKPDGSSEPVSEYTFRVRR